MPLLLATDFESVWASSLKIWFQSTRCRFLETSAPSVVLVPSLSVALAVRARLADEKFAFAGIHFWTPADARRFLAGMFPDVLPAIEAESLRLLMSHAALEALAGDTRALSARAIAENPEVLLRSLGRLDDAGWGAEEMGTPELQALGKRLQAKLQQLGLATTQARDFEIGRRLRGGVLKGAAIDKLFIMGFHGGHWPFWPLVESLTLLAGETTAVIRSPRNDGLSIDAAWIGTLEGLLGPAELAPVAHLPQDRPFYRHAEAVWCGTEQHDASARLKILVARGISSEARLAVRQAKAYLGAPGARRVGIVVPSNGALAREIAAGLEASDLLYWNDLGTPVPGFYEQPAWKAFLTFHEQPTPDRLVSMLAAGAKPTDVEVTATAFADLLRKARNETFCDRLDILAAHLSKAGDTAGVGAALASLRGLPARATCANFAAALRQAMVQVGWATAADDLLQDSALVGIRDLEVERKHFVRWAEGRAHTLTRTAGQNGGHPYARIVLTTYDHADGVAWTHLVLTGLNEGGFPRPYGDAGLLGEETIYDLNSKVRRLNDESTRVVAGAGVSVIPGKGMLLGPVEERWNEQQIFVGLLESVSKAATVTLSVSDELDGGKALRPCEYFVRLYQAITGKAPAAGELDHFATDVSAETIIPVDMVPEVRSAYDSRRDMKRPFDEFSFCFRAEDPHQVFLSASAWEKVDSYPATLWCRGALGLSLGNDSGEMPWALTTGDWAHAWLATAAPAHGVVVNERAAGHYRAAVDTASTKHLKTFKRFFAELPQWWLAVFESARMKARRLADSLDAIDREKWPAFACEAKLPRGSKAILPEGVLQLYGRLDLVFFDRRGVDVTSLLQAGARCWLFDFKSGKQQKLSRKRLAGGDGSQLGLYSMALHGAGASDVGITLLKPSDKSEMQLVLSDVLAERSLWKRYLTLQERGNFGQLEVVRGEFGAAAEFPLATLPIPLGVLERKWALTHPEE